MQQTSYHAKYTALKLLEQKHHNTAEGLIPIISSANIEIFPHQIEAACFAFNSPYSKGAILCDETGLGYDKSTVM